MAIISMFICSWTVHSRTVCSWAAIPRQFIRGPAVRGLYIRGPAMTGPSILGISVRGLAILGPTIHGHVLTVHGLNIPSRYHKTQLDGTQPYTTQFEHLSQDSTYRDSFRLGQRQLDTVHSNLNHSNSTDLTRLDLIQCDPTSWSPK